MSKPHRALDYPQLPDTLWIVWSGNEYRWPDARRETHYLTDQRLDIMGGFALFTPYADCAATFDTEQEAREWLASMEAKRPHPYNVTISTVGDMKQAKGYVA